MAPILTVIQGVLANRPQSVEIARRFEGRTLVEVRGPNTPGVAGRRRHDEQWRRITGTGIVRTGGIAEKQVAVFVERECD